jgi:hypothetical protein
VKGFIFGIVTMILFLVLVCLGRPHGWGVPSPQAHIVSLTLDGSSVLQRHYTLPRSNNTRRTITTKPTPRSDSSPNFCCAATSAGCLSSTRRESPEVLSACRFALRSLSLVSAKAGPRSGFSPPRRIKLVDIGLNNRCNRVEVALCSGRQKGFDSF